MAQQNINTGSNPNDGTGDPLRTAFAKTEDNFTDLYNQLGSSFPFTSSATQPAQIVGENEESTVLGITGSLEATENITASVIELGSEIVAKNNTSTKITLSDNTMGMFVNGEKFLEIDGSGVRTIIKVNPDQQSIDFRAEGDATTDLLYVDASTDRVGIKTETPAYDFDVNGTAKANQYYGAIISSDPAVSNQFFQTASSAIIEGASGFSVVCISP